MPIERPFAFLAALVTLVVAASGAGAQVAGLPDMDSLPDADSISNLFGSASGDSYSSVILHQIFGPLFPSATGVESATVFSAIIGYFNVAVLAIGGMLFFYNVSVGILQSAHEGKVLGQRWSSLWAPLRIVFAVGLLVPVPGYGGYNVAQAGVAYLVKGSTSIASMIWTESAILVVDRDIPITTNSGSIDVEMIETLYRNAACLATIEYQRRMIDSDVQVAYFDIKNFFGDESLERSMLRDAIWTDDPAQYLASRRGQATAILTDGEFQSRGICGSWQGPDVPDYLERQIAEAGDYEGDPAAARTIVNNFLDGHEAIMINLIGKIREDMMDTGAEASPGGPVLDAIFVDNTEPPIISDEIADVIRQANAEMAILHDQLRSDVMNLDVGYTARDRLLDHITGGSSCIEARTSGMSDTEVAAGGASEGVSGCYGEGWMGAGSWYIVMARMNNELSSLLNAMSSATGPSYGNDQRALYNDLGGEGSGWFFGNVTQADVDALPSSEEAVRLVNRYEEMVSRSMAQLAAFGVSIGSSEMVQLSTGPEGTGENANLVARLGLNDVLSRGLEGFINFFDPSNRSFDPMMGLVNIGNVLINIGFAIMAAAVFGGILSSGVAIVALPIFSVLITAGLSLSFILPMMPFLFWVFGVTGYLLLVVEAVVAVNLFALGHMRMDGDGLSGEAGRTGWILILSLLMTPVLMVLGFLVGMLIFRAASDLFSAGMFYAAQSVAGGNLIIQTFGLIAYSILIVVAYIALLERSFSLVSGFPGQVMRWMGGDVRIDNGDENRVRIAGGAAAAGINQASNAMERGAVTVKTNPDGLREVGGFAGGVRRVGQRFFRNRVSRG